MSADHHTLARSLEQRASRLQTEADGLKEEARRLLTDGELESAVATKLLDARAAAALLGVSPKRLYDMNSRGEGPPALRLGRSLRWSSRALEEWIRERSTLE